MSDDPYSQELLASVLAEQRVWALLISRRDTEMTGALLSELHMISRRVFVASADQPSSLATTRWLRTAPRSRQPSGSSGIP